MEELSVGEILRRSFHLYRVMLGKFLVLFVVTGLVSYAMNTAVGAVRAIVHRLDADLSSFASGDLLDFIVGLALRVSVIGVVNTIASGMAVKYSSDVLQKGEGNLRESFRFTLSRLAPLLGAGIIAGTLEIIGLICLVVPGIILLIMFHLVVPVIVIEDVGIHVSLGRSRRLVSKRWRKTFAILSFFMVLFLVLEYSVETLASSIMSPLDFWDIITSVGIALLQPIDAISTVFLYYSMVARETKPAIPADDHSRLSRRVPDFPTDVLILPF